MNMRRMWFWICAMALTAATVCAQHYPILPVPNSPPGIYTLFQDSRSALWLGTANNVFRFDGEHFYSLRPYGFPKEVPVSFAEDGDGGMWIATQGTAAVGGNKGGGLYRYQSGRVTQMIAGDAMTVVSVAPGIVLASMGTETSGRPAFGDLYLLRKSQSDSSHSIQGWTAQLLLQKQVNHLTLDHQGNLLFPCPGGWCQIDCPDAGISIRGTPRGKSPHPASFAGPFRLHLASSGTIRQLSVFDGCGTADASG
jgi:hypothetical protein